MSIPRTFCTSPKSKWEVSNFAAIYSFTENLGAEYSRRLITLTEDLDDFCTALAESVADKLSLNKLVAERKQAVAAIRNVRIISVALFCAYSLLVSHSTLSSAKGGMKKLTMVAMKNSKT